MITKQAAALILLGAGLAAPIHAKATTTKMCIFDIAGRSGPAFAQAKDYAVAAKTWGANIELEAYVDETGQNR